MDDSAAPSLRSFPYPSADKTDFRRRGLNGHRYSWPAAIFFVRFKSFRIKERSQVCKVLQYIIILTAIFSTSSITLLTSSEILASSPGKDSAASDYDLDKRTRTRTFEPTHTFEFRAYNICNEQYEQCFNIWGDGRYNFDAVSARGNYEKYKEVRTNVLESGWWRDSNFISASDASVIFDAEPGVGGPGLSGFIVIEIFEGETSDTGRVCVYGNLFDKQNPSSKADADCTDSANVEIEPVN